MKFYRSETLAIAKRHGENSCFSQILRAQLVNGKVGSGYLTQLDCMGPLCSQYLKIMRFSEL